jgi:tetratricopeptide (TPR) repeat protein
MAFSEKIRLIFEVNDRAAVGSFGNITKSIRDTEGARGKMQAGLTSTGQFLKANMAEAALAAGAALVAFGVSSVKAFQNTAIEAGKLSDALGINVEDASRLMEVAGDLGVDMGALQGAMQRFNKEVGAGKVDLKQFGTDLVYAKDGSVDAYESFLSAATAVGAIVDPTQRAKEAQRLFGRSYGEIAELMEMDAKDLREALGDVSDAKVIDREEIGKAREFREAMDTVKDTVEDVQLQFGELLVEAAPAIVATAKLVGGLATALADAYEFQTKLVEAFATGGEAEALNKLGTSYEDLGIKTKLAGIETDSVTGYLADLETQTEDTAVEVETLEDRWRDLKSEISDRQSFLELQGTFDDLKSKAEDVFIAVAEGNMSVEAAARENELAQLAAKEELIEYIEKVLELPPEATTKIVAAFEDGNLEYVESQLAVLSRDREARLVVTTIAAGGSPTSATPGTVVNPNKGKVGVGATGGIVTQPTWALIGEAGPEAVVPLNTMPGASPLPSGGNAPSYSGGGGMVINNYGNNPNAVIAAIKQYERLNGTGWRR